MHTPSLLAFSGSTRQASFNQSLVQIAAHSAEQAGAQVTVINLRDYPLPLYDQDLQTAEGMPAHAVTLKHLIQTHHGLLLASPEYNGSLSGVLKNAIDWASRRDSPDEPLCFKGKTVSLMSTSPGALGGLRGLVHIRAILSGLGCLVLPDQLAVPTAHQAFSDDSRLNDAALQSRLDQLIQETVRVTRQLHSDA